METIVTGAENIRWVLDKIYTSIADPQIDKDIKLLIEMFEKFNVSYKGMLSEKLGHAVSMYADIHMLEDKIMFYLFLKQSTNVADSAVKAKIADTERILSNASAKYMTFFNIELVSLDDNILVNHYDKDIIAAKHRPWIEHLRIFKPHLLSEPVESALTKRSPFGFSAWSEFFDELEADIEGEFHNEKKTLTELLHLMTESKDCLERAELLKIIDDSLKGFFAKYSAQTLYMVAGTSSVEVQDRAYKNPMDARNKSNRIPDNVVDILHKTIETVAAPLAQRYYRLKAAHLGLKTLRWSDRNAPMPFADTSVIPFNDAKSIVISAFESFSPKLAELAVSFFEEKRIDAPAIKGKRGGAFNYTAVLPGSMPVSYVFLNYLGSNRDVMTLAHELGHGVHGLLSGKAQGVLMAQAPIAYAETASVFSEMAAFKFLKERLINTNDKKSLLSLLMGKIDDILNTSVRQISFSNFERRIHGFDSAAQKWNPPKKFAVKELNDIWIDCTKQFYGDVFTYENAEHLWSYISHFHSPFYVYGYAFGELLTQGLYAKQSLLGERFEPLYIDLLSSGSTKSVVDLVKPFDINLTNENFWISGIENGLGNMIAEAEFLSKQILK